VSREEFLFKVLVGLGIVFLGVGGYFGNLLLRFPEFKTVGEWSAFIGSGLMSLVVVAIIVALAIFLFRRLRWKNSI